MFTSFSKIRLDKAGNFCLKGNVSTASFEQPSPMKFTSLEFRQSQNATKMYQCLKAIYLQ